MQRFKRCIKHLSWMFYRVLDTTKNYYYEVEKMKKESLALSILGAEKFLCKVENTLPKLMKLTKQMLEDNNLIIVGKVIDMITIICPNIAYLVIENYNTTFREDCRLVRELVDTIPTIELINELNNLKELYLGIRSSSELGTQLNKIRHIASLLDDEICKIMQYEIRYQLQDTLIDQIGGAVKDTESNRIGTVIEVDPVRTLVEFTEVDEFDNTEIKVQRWIRNRNLEIIVLTNCVDNDKLENEQENNIEVEKENKNMNTKLIVKVMENRGTVTTDIHFENPTSGKTLLGNNALVRKFKSEFGSKFHSYKNGVFFGTNLKGLGNDISVFADMNDCDFYQYLNNDCVVEPLVVTDEVIEEVENLIETIPAEVVEEIEEKVNAMELIQEIKEENKEVAPQVEEVAPIVETEVIVELNSEKKGIEIKFNAKPSAEQRAELKACGYRWHAKKELWYAKQTDDAMALANKFAPVVVEPVAPKKEIKIDVNFNDAKKGIEIKFNGVPSESVRTKLKDAGYRWYKTLGLWIAKQSNEDAMALAKKCLAPKTEKVVAPVVAEKVEEVAPVKNAFALIQEIKSEQEIKVTKEEIAIDKKKKFDALQDRKLKAGFVSMQDIIDNKGKQGNYSNEFNVHARFLNKILNNPNFNVIEIDRESYGFNITGIEGRYETYNKNCYTSNRYIHEITQENTESIKAQILADIEASKENNWYEKKGYSMKIEGIYDLNKAYITLRTNRKIYKFVSPGYALDKFNEVIDGYTSDYRKINSIDEHIKDYNKLVKWLEIAVKENLKFLATWLKHDIENELKCIDKMKKIMSDKLEKIEDFKALQYSENLKIEA